MIWLCYILHATDRRLLETLYPYCIKTMRQVRVKTGRRTKLDRIYILCRVEIVFLNCIHDWNHITFCKGVQIEFEDHLYMYVGNSEVYQCDVLLQSTTVPSGIAIRRRRPRCTDRRLRPLRGAWPRPHSSRPLIPPPPTCPPVDCWAGTTVLLQQPRRQQQRQPTPWTTRRPQKPLRCPGLRVRIWDSSAWCAATPAPESTTESWPAMAALDFSNAVCGGNSFIGG